MPTQHQVTARRSGAEVASIAFAHATTTVGEMMPAQRIVIVLTVWASAVLVAGPEVRAQTDSSRVDSLRNSLVVRRETDVGVESHNDTARRAVIFTAADGRNLLIVLATTAAMLPLDKTLTHEFRDAGPQRSALLHDGARAFDFLGSPGTVLATGGAYVIGRVIGSDHLADLALHVGESLALTLGETYLIKGVLGRQRPYVDLTDPDDFVPARGFRKDAWASLPSGHTAAAFSVAASANEEIRHWWPAAPWVITPVLYTGAGMVGLARIYDAKHWSSDVVLAAGLGILTGRKVAQYHHGAIAAAKWPRWPRISATGRGLSLAWGF